MMSANQRWKSLVDLSAMLLSGELDLDALVEEIANKESDEREAGRDGDEIKKKRKTEHGEGSGRKIEIPNYHDEGIVQKCILDLGGSEDSIALVIQKKLFESDVNPRQCRLSIPHNQVKGPFFEKLRESEAAQLDEGIPVTLFGTHGEKHNMKLKNWKSNNIYVLTGGWRDVCRAGRLKVNRTVQLWCFRRNSDLCLALF